MCLSIIFGRMCVQVIDLHIALHVEEVVMAHIFELENRSCLMQHCDDSVTALRIFYESASHPKQSNHVDL